MTLTRNGYLGTAAAMTVISWIAQSSNDNLTFGGFIAAPFMGAILHSSSTQCSSGQSTS